MRALRAIAPCKRSLQEHREATPKEYRPSFDCKTLCAESAIASGTGHMDNRPYTTKGLPKEITTRPLKTRQSSTFMDTRPPL
jgi:hypothetical protein